MAHVMWQNTLACRACGFNNLSPVFDFGDMPLADKLETVPDSTSAAPRVPLSVLYCSRCSLSQLSVSVSPELLFDSSYPYYSSVSPALQRHFAESAQSIISKFGIGYGNLVVEAASNDGYMLRHFQAAGARVIGFDPASGPASVARNAGIDTRIRFFGPEVARELASSGERADVFLANNVLAHVPDLTGFVAAIAEVLKSDGVAIIEVPYLADMVEGGEFDTIYHQHLCYFTLTSLEKLFATAGMRLESVERTGVHGGSLRLFAVHGSGSGDSTRRLVAVEQQNGWHELAFADRIGDAANTVRHGLVTLTGELKATGHTICGYGAAAKAATLLAWCGLDNDSISFVSDLNSRKHGKFMPGTDLEICAPERILEQQPDHVLILAWNFADEIMQQLAAYRQLGGQFIVPIPNLRIL